MYETTIVYENVDVLGTKSNVQFTFTKVSFDDIDMDYKLSEFLVTTDDSNIIKAIESTYAMNLITLKK